MYWRMSPLEIYLEYYFSSTLTARVAAWYILIFVNKN